MYEYKAKVLRVKDGDTFDCLIDLGFGVHHEVEIRMYGVNAPETRTKDPEEKKAGLAAKRYLNSLIGRRTVFLQTMKTKTGSKKKSFTRYIARVYLNGFRKEFETINVGLRMIQDGYAKKFTEKDLLEQRKAKRAKKGKK
jgi:endonuclease YncB( thermonuclease family)